MSLDKCWQCGKNSTGCRCWGQTDSTGVNVGTICHVDHGTYEERIDTLNATITQQKEEIEAFKRMQNMFQTVINRLYEDEWHKDECHFWVYNDLVEAMEFPVLTKGVSDE